jgi:hypothetical protein
MTGYESKKAAAQAKTIDEVNWLDHELDDDDTQVYQDHDDALTIAYQSGYYDGKKAAQPAQEPVNDVRGFLAARLTCWHRLTQKESNELVALFEVKPPQRPWVGLTEEEVKHEWEVWRANIPRYAGFAKAIEAKLKEKNNAA